MTFKDYYLLTENILKIKSLNGKKEANIILWRKWLRNKQQPGYDGVINFPGETVKLPKVINLKDLYPVIQRNLVARGYDTKTYKNIKPDLSYYGWEDPDALVNEPDYDPDKHMQISAFNQSLPNIMRQADNIVNDIENSEEETPKNTIFKKGDKIQLVKDLHTDMRWVDEPQYILPRVGTHGILIGVIPTHRGESVLVSFKGFKNTPIAVDSNYVRKIGLASFE